MAERQRTSIPCDRDTLEAVRQLKRHGQSYDTLLRKMADQYDPEAN